tara:strand:- start:9045 stop:9617 length:573 start_codon:yes stop_codon:yes gene_type:complete
LKVLIVAHPDDEIIWFDPLYFNLIIIAFCERPDRVDAGRNRLKAIKHHPLRDRIRMLNIPESGYWKDKSRLAELAVAGDLLTKMIYGIQNGIQISEVYTHNSLGEYGHDDHIMVHKCVVNVFREHSHCKIYSPTRYMNADLLNGHRVIKSKINIDFYKRVKNIYLENNCWTWDSSYVPNLYEEYYQVGGI